MWPRSLMERPFILKNRAEYRVFRGERNKNEAYEGGNSKSICIKNRQAQIRAAFLSEAEQDASACTRGGSFCIGRKANVVLDVAGRVEACGRVACVERDQ